MNDNEKKSKKKTGCSHRDHEQERGAANKDAIFHERYTAADAGADGGGDSAACGNKFWRKCLEQQGGGSRSDTDSSSSDSTSGSESAGTDTDVSSSEESENEGGDPAHLRSERLLRKQRRRRGPRSSTPISETETERTEQRLSLEQHSHDILEPPEIGSQEDDMLHDETRQVNLSALLQDSE